MFSAHALHSEEKKKGLSLNCIWEQDEEMGSEILCPVSLQCFWQECAICALLVIACQLGSKFRSSRKEKEYRYSNPVAQTQELISNAHRYRVYAHLVCIWFCFSQTFSMASRVRTSLLPTTVPLFPVSQGKDVFPLHTHTTILHWFNMFSYIK